MSSSSLEQLWASGHLAGGNLAFIDELYESYLRIRPRFPRSGVSFLMVFPV